MEQWQEIKLADICEIKYGKDHKKLDDGNIPVYGSGGIIRYVDTYIYDNKSVLIPRKGTLKNLFFVDGKFWTVDTIFWTKFKNSNVFEKYIYYFLQTQNLESYNVGTAVPSLTTSILNELKVNLPPLEEQKAIAKTLSCLDEKIELNNKINKNLEEMAQAIFKKWFIDFDYPLTEEEIANGGREFVDSELGKIPKGWKVGKLGDLVKEANTGADAIKKAPIVDFKTNFKCVRVGDISNNRNFENWGYCDISSKVFEKYRLEKGDILITRTSFLGLNIYISENLNAVYNNGLIRLKFNNIVDSQFLYLYINTKNFFDYINRITGESSTRPNMKIDYLLSFPIIIPNDKIKNKFVKIISKILENKNNIIFENEKLTQIRDTLLPKLINGDVRVPY